MCAFENIVQSAAERLMEDERLRANLTDDEASLLVNWAIEWLEGRVAKARSEAAARQIVQSEMARLRQAMQKINDLLVPGNIPSLPDALKVLGLSQTRMTASQGLDRPGVIRALTLQLAKTWRK